MMQTVTTAPPVTANDRLSMTVFFAILFHGILILGITFISSPSAKQKIPPSLDVILVNTSNPSEPEKADYLAQVSQDGGGTSEKKVRPTDMFSAPSLSQKPGIALQQSVTTTPSTKQTKKENLLTQNSAPHKINTQETSSKEETQQQLTAALAKRRYALLICFLHPHCRRNPA